MPETPGQNRSVYQRPIAASAPSSGARQAMKAITLPSSVQTVQEGGTVYVVTKFGTYERDEERKQDVGSNGR